jgi:hypothetical protein
MAGITEYFPCEFFSMAEECRRPVHRGRLRRRARVGAGCGVPRAWLVTTPREAPETEPSATTSGREELTDGEALLASSRAGPEPINRRGGAPRGERPASWDVRRRAEARSRASSTHYAPADLRYWSADGCRCTRAPVGAPLPSLCAVRKTTNLGEPMPRENEAACVRRCRWQKARSAETRFLTIVPTYWYSLMFDLDAGARAPHITASQASVRTSRG